MIDRGFTTKTIEEMAEAAKNDPDFEFDKWEYNEKSKVLGLWKENGKLVASIVIKETEDGFVAKSVW